jgi:sulfatase modifying factor 1
MNRIIPPSLLGCLSFLLLPVAAIADMDGTLTFQHSADVQTWSDIEITPEMIDEDGRLLLRGVPNPSFFRLKADFAASAAPEGMVLVEGGTLSTTNALNGTEVATFYMGIHEVTWGEWQEVRAWGEASGYEWPSWAGAGCAADHPVHTVNWYDALKWSNAKSEMEGLTPVYTVSGAVYRTGTGEPDHTTISQNLSANGYRLPLEAEWEFAARGGNQTNGYTYAGSNELNAVGWYLDNSGGAACGEPWSGLERGTWPVGQKASNELGLYDMSGSVWEWCWDHGRIRGGGWFDPADNCTVSLRGNAGSNNRFDHYGFRLARSFEE